LTTSQGCATPEGEWGAATGRFGMATVAKTLTMVLQAPGCTGLPQGARP
jgi:hypothetical protein